MHYYKRNIGDYAKKAARLTMLQHGAYTLLMDSCYDREEFPTLDQAIDWCWASSKEEIEAVEFVLSKFFTLENDVFVQQRIKSELDRYHQNAETNKRIAKEREAKRKEKSTVRAQSVNDSSTKLDQAPPNHKPLTTNQEPLTKNQELRTINQEPNDSNINTDSVIDYLNAKTNQRYRHSETSRKNIRARLKDFSVQDCMTVVDKKAQEWLNNDMAKYLRPETLFGSKFESYLNQPIAQANQRDNEVDDWVNGGERVINGEVINNEPF